jgi:hypothetical protein
MKTQRSNHVTGQTAGLKPRAAVGVVVLDESVYVEALTGKRENKIACLAPVPCGGDGRKSFCCLWPRAPDPARVHSNFRMPGARET